MTERSTAAHRDGDFSAESPGMLGQEQAAPSARRSFLKRAAVTAAVPGMMVAGSSLGRGATRGNFPNLYPNWNSRNFHEIRQDEDSHVAVIINVLNSVGATPRPKPTFQNLIQPNIQSFVATSQAFENTGVGAYQGAAPYIYTSGILGLALSIALVEALHSGYLNTLENTPIVPNGSSFSQPLTVPVIVQRVSPYIASLNGGPDPMTEISTTLSLQNDIAIVNFALLLEYLEREFYDLNVPRFFG